MHYKRWQKSGDPLVLKRTHFRDLTGERFGRLSVTRRDFSEKVTRRTMWRCQCDCGNQSVVESSNLQLGRVRSCGCLLRELEARGGGALKHGATRCREKGTRPLPEYRTWIAIIARCENPKNKRWANYGSRGITVCARWRHSFPNFFKDMGRRPTAKHSIERKNNDGNYAPKNCIWATATQQANNRRPRGPNKRTMPWTPSFAGGSH